MYVVVGYVVPSPSQPPHVEDGVLIWFVDDCLVVGVDGGECLAFPYPLLVAACAGLGVLPHELAARLYDAYNGVDSPNIEAERTANAALFTIH